jgi:cyanophycinase-like exopeptidase
MALARSAPGLAVVVAAAETPETARAYEHRYRAWGGPPCRVLTLRSREEAFQTAHARTLLEARLILIADGDIRRLLETFFDTPALQAMLTAYHAGAVLVGIGAGAEAMGTWVLRSGRRKPSAHGAGSPAPLWSATTRLRSPAPSRPPSTGVPSPTASASPKEPPWPWAPTTRSSAGAPARSP